NYCVAKLGQPAEKYQGYLDYACGKFDCWAIQASGPCFRPDTLVSHASYILDLVYHVTGNCYPDIGVLTTFNRSYGDCQYP
ncbi:glucan endo-1 3-beta-glucosidase, partial [Phtheirospermum japonicum]